MDAQPVRPKGTMPCPKCEDGWVQYWIASDTYGCPKCKALFPWSEEIEEAFRRAFPDSP
jgi:hypothetical protein